MVKYALAAAALAATASALPSKLESRGKLIVGGEEAVAGDFPFIVSLQEGGSHFCGGSLLNANTVVTAAHCSVGQDPSSTKVRAGTLTWSSGGVEVGVSKITVHPDYDSGATNNDVAIWKLSEEIPEGDGISYVTLPAAGSDPAAGDEVEVAGWGTLEEGGSNLPEDLMKVTVPIVGREECAKQYGGSSITEAMICAGIEQGGKDACQGDSGGPLVDASQKLVGIVSWGQGCAQAGFAGVYTHVGQFVDFIKNNA